MPEPLVPEDIENVTFPTSLRGYDRDSVDIFLQEVAAAYEIVLTEAKLARTGAQKPYRGLGEEMGDLLQHAKDSAEETKRAAAEEAGRVRQRAVEEAAETLAVAEKRAAEMRAEAEQAAADKMHDAAETVAQLETMETEAHERLTSLRLKLESLTGQLLDLEASRSTKAPTAPPPAGDDPDDEDISLVSETISSVDGTPAPSSNQGGM